MFDIITVPDQAASLPEQLGTKRKFWYRDENSVRCLFKEGRPLSGDDWSEKVASELCDRLGLPHVRYELATWKGRRGVVSQTFVPRAGSLIHGNELLATIVRGYPTQKIRGVSQHTIRRIFAVLRRRDFQVTLPIGWKTFGDVETAGDVFIGYLVLDAWIANQDRHHENWGLAVAGFRGSAHMKVLYLAWRDPENRSWFPVGRLSFDGKVYQFVYTKGVKKTHHFVPFGRMNNLTATYESTELFPLFANRLLSKKRPEYQDWLRWLNIPVGKDDPLTLLAQTGGVRETDTLAVFPCPEPTAENQYRVQFFSHGLRHLPEGSLQRVNELHTGERLYLMPDPQNRHDTCAIALRTDDPVTIVGYCPRYLTRDFLRFLTEFRPSNVAVTVERVNIDAPMQLRLLCYLTAPWLEGFRPCSEESYEPYAAVEGGFSLTEPSHTEDA